MTAINVYPLPDVAYLFSDGASYNLDGELMSIEGKTQILSSISTAMLFSGRSILTPYIVHHLQRLSESFDHLMEIMPDRLASMEDHLTEMFGVDVSPESGEAKQGYRIFVAGWSERRRRIVTFSISSVEDSNGREAYTIHEAPRGLQSPCVSNEQVYRGFGGPFNVTADNIDHVAVTMVELQREKPFENGQYCVGGLVELVTVRRDHVDVRILHRWHEDVIGETIRPVPVDWAAWRARRTAGAVAQIPAGLSRLQRARMEKKARKGTLRTV